MGVDAPVVMEWTNLIARWFHIVAGIAWIGSSFFFIWLDRNLVRPSAPPPRVEGELWMVHSGGFYRMEKRFVSPSELPETLHWVKWEATLTWLSGMLLLTLIYYLTDGIYLLDASVSALTTGQGIALSLGVLAAGLALYELVWRSPLARAGWPATLVSLLLLGLAIVVLFTSLSGRAAFIHAGALMGTIMVANVWIVIIPSQRRMVAAAARGEEPDFSEGERAKVRSVHNSYLTFPVIFTMISLHYPQTYAGAWGWLVLILLSIAGGAARHAMIGGPIYGLRKEWALAPMVAGVLAAIALATPARALPESVSLGDAAGASFAEARVVIAARCASCHSAAPTDALFRAAPNGVAFDTPQQMRGYAARILERAVVQRTMPFADQGGMTDGEREVLRRWIGAGAPLR